MSTPRISKRAANLLSSDLLDKIAEITEKNQESLRISPKFAQMFVSVCDQYADHVDKLAGIDRRASVKPKVAQELDFDENFTLTPIQGENFDPSEIGEEYDGPFLQDGDEPYMDVFKQDEYYQLGEVQEEGLFSNAKAAKKTPSRRRK